MRSYSLVYPTVAALTAPQRKAVGDGRFDWLEGTILPASGGGWLYILEGSAFYDATPPEDNALIGDLAYVGAPQIQDSAYVDFVDDLAPTVAALKAGGEWYDPHPWFNGFLPDAAADALVTATMDATTPADLGASGLVLLYPVPTAKFTTPLLSVPDGEIAFLFAVLRTAAPGRRCAPGRGAAAGEPRPLPARAGRGRQAVPGRGDPDDAGRLAEAVRRALAGVPGGEAAL